MTDKTNRKTHNIDATDKIVGRLATRIALLLSGKGKRTYAPNVDGGDYVVVSNIKNIKTSGAKIDQKEYKHFSGYPGGLKKTKWSIMLATNPKKLLWLSVYRMLPKNRLRKDRIRRLTIE
ncbi:50S ribosomal protein L13 [Candidatus Uhrbacteria bacterium RIFCSPLOWO2_01_FULL_47_24]|uniref:Large ribosomal subunit protein uL13 n=1 Tax=Candidatus Uhrbacteria bacterium RIFCSPLOWO2_01_FULL_47_24 TaxID=1802401 RepID=A0A1F7UNQ9_9BACT|nr:MAG: 50S ribosomal protein L13 [Candidatus Uhrbacteria bacterium RIFCSPHIGHO2_01_FULL_47_11]OGL68576.1 MAG: 50S ribosomal protein L13 [Candidatus Uhrbacteria bacterium RIFCSPHIGHO2_02_FULL_46_47]OGL79921.1 MAG: 50S ribosomal protein L13 [Candidatus Uhrbacteria bacterium RIFCSPLOWO2_01_FULL_47_24]OGL84782.1 MAG: 50S ribosomal protein L13 [Candidatus Uhrbacteria bacterium RIFCSPLOWO2_02_FULL_46_25]OGL93445.1 MAG: 50S ribosomal protein L13 [Candidatus Uhrbacteria bacterium RIFCSPLOWO2_12_FULL_4